MKKLALLCFLWLGIGILGAQIKDRVGPLMFVPPQLEGTFSIGIYDAKGKLVRTLFADAPSSSFQVGLNGYLFAWDGKDDSGQPMPAGKYSAHGYVVGNVNVEGEDFLFNDWVTSEDEPIVERVLKIYENPKDKNKLIVEAQTKNEISEFEADAAARTSRYMGKGTIAEDYERPAPPSFLKSQEVLSVSVGKGNTWWAVLRRTEGGGEITVVGQFSQSGEFLRELKQPADEPPFAEVVARGDTDLIWVLAQDENRQILRALRPSFTVMDVPNEDSKANWEIVLERRNEKCGQFGFVDGNIVPKIDGEIPNTPIGMALIANNLEPGVQRVKLRTLQKPDGGWIGTADGLPLLRVSEKPPVRQALTAGPEPGTALWYQSDGAVVEEYRVEGLKNMASFDVGEFDLQ